MDAIITKPPIFSKSNSNSAETGRKQASSGGAGLQKGHRDIQPMARMN
ncbi:MAG: hypothetical protein WA825_08900 [Steroidobacteraceae bacterium]